MRSERLLAPVSLLLAVLSGCGTSAFGPTFPENQEPEFSRVMRALRDAPARDPRPVVVGVGGEPPALFTWDLREGRMLWSREADITSAPIAAGSMVVLQEGARVVAHHLESGEEAFALDREDARLVGADGDGEWTAISMAYGPEASPHGWVVAARGDSVRWDRELQLPVGVPAVSGGIVVVPWATQRISMLDAALGTERTRVRIRDAVVGRAFVSGGSLWVGQHGLFRLSPAIEAGTTDQAEYYEPVARPLPGQPPLLPDGYEPVAPPSGAQHRLRMVWRVEREGDGLGLADDNLYFLFYRFLFALDPNEDTVRWVYRHTSDLVGAEAVDGGVMLASAAGDVLFVEAGTGARSWTAVLGTEISVAQIRSAGWSPDEREPVETEPLAAQLFDAATMDDDRLAGGRALAVRHLATFEGAEITGQLIGLCSKRSDPEPVRLAACAAVGERTDGIEHVRAALRIHASYIDGVDAPPAGALAKAAGRMGRRMLIPLLLEHLEDPATPNAELPSLFEGLAMLGHRSAVRPIETFLRLYHADSGDPHLVAAVGAALRALAQLGGGTAEETLVMVANDTLAGEAVQRDARAALESLRAPSEAPQESEPEPEPEPEPEDTRPARITPAMTARVFQRTERRLRRCIPEGSPSIRIAMLVQPSGEVATSVVSPAGAQTCVEPLLGNLQFPETRLRTPDQIVYTVRTAER